MATDGSWLTTVGETPADAAYFASCRLAAASVVERARPDLLDADGLEYVPTGDVLHAARMLTDRLYARKGSPGGLASFGEFGPAALPRFDPDIERLLGVGRYARPAVG